jgi:hypothetical protein
MYQSLISEETDRVLSSKSRLSDAEWDPSDAPSHEPVRS